MAKSADEQKSALQRRLEKLSREIAKAANEARPTQQQAEDINRRSV